ncbi:Vitamin K-dependent gamma-carboxylase [Bernardetia litoralis DSM 6794]|uniref:Vitamin K-dependent gamma-carboxylase n=1 Tax=Bernardetia litoralis (strain ATCC 23117 / DSM 6794 / NBRC 15988 / NCIMB 1366 / Fx l1 / Sio-4) TaxID=880071 RepID=I4AGN5_BERLS|nr:HTTM domain-containing protein [Bernardetia litoralis]AFM03120.1 Vitamin K-dependent gamma-carboxylase [Bernardetia litoralis DSM 6794]
MKLYTKLKNFLNQPIDIAPLIYARIILGILMTFELCGGALSPYGKTLITGDYHFSYSFAPFIKPWSEPFLMYAHFGINFILGLMVVFGFKYRFACIAMFFSATSIFLMEKTLYINHVYLYCILFLVFAFLPANRAFSVDAHQNPKIKSSEIPAWTVYCIVFQLSIVYFYAGIAKLNIDWLHAQPMQMWLAGKINHPIPYLGILLAHKSHAFLVAYGGIIFDLLVVPLMLWKKTRKLAFILAIFFHAINALTFGIGTFPWFSIAATALFFPPSVFRNWWIFTYFDKKLPKQNTHLFKYSDKSKLYQNFVYSFFILFFVIQFFLPWRAFLYGEDPSWTEQGHFFSWRMMLRSKKGITTFHVSDAKSNKNEIANPSKHLSYRQRRKMYKDPDMILQYVHFLAEFYKKEKGYKEPIIKVKSEMSLNNRKKQLFIDSNIDLTKEKQSWRLYKWVIPLRETEYIENDENEDPSD